MSIETVPRCTVVEILDVGANRPLETAVHSVPQGKTASLPFVVTGGTDAISFAPGSDADDAAAAGRNPLTPNSDFLLIVQYL